VIIDRLKNVRKLRNFSVGPWLSKTRVCSRQDAKNAKSGSLISCGPFDVAQDMLCAFARDTPSFGCGFAALGTHFVVNEGGKANVKWTETQ